MLLSADGTRNRTLTMLLFFWLYLHNHCRTKSALSICFKGDNTQPSLQSWADMISIIKEFRLVLTYDRYQTCAFTFHKA